MKFLLVQFCTDLRDNLSKLQFDEVYNQIYDHKFSLQCMSADLKFIFVIGNSADYEEMLQHFI